MKISRETARRFILGDQGLWPHRRWKGKSGAELAMRAVQQLQLDPLDIGARAHDLILHSRVRGYKKSFYEELVYQDKKFFEWGGWLATRPIDEWPYWMVLMERASKYYERNWTSVSRRHVEDVLEILETEGATRNRDFKSELVAKTYRGGKASSLALYQLWIKGEIVTSGRERFERIYDLAHRFVPDHLRERASDEEADLFIAQKDVAFHGLSRMQGLRSLLKFDITPQAQTALREKLLRENRVSEVTVEGWKEKHYVLSSKVPLLKTLESGRVPQEWRVARARDEALLLSPLDVVSARGRAKKVFDFDYVWEVYKPLEQRKWGYYTLPVLWRDQLVARLDPSLDRKTGTLRILGLWLEDARLKKDEEFLEALAASLLDLKRLFEAKTIHLGGVSDRAVKKALEATSFKYSAREW